MKSVKILMAATAVALLAVPCVQADNVILEVEVPFEFVVADQVLPSGAYRIEQEPDTRLVHVYSEGNEHRAVAHGVRLAPGANASGELVFNKYGERRFLRVIRAGNGEGSYLLETRLEQAARADAVGMP